MNNYLLRLTQAQNLLGLYRAEWLSSKLFDHFNEPGYFSELKTNRPCVLIGGRGTGKTTVLKGLSYDGQFTLNQLFTKREKIKDWQFIGIYYRANTNRVTTFGGNDVSLEKWIRYFSHYINLCFCKELVRFSLWYEQTTGEKIEISSRKWRNINKVFQFDQSIESLDYLDEEIEISLLEFESSINQVIDNPPTKITMLGLPIDILSEALISNTVLEGKQFFFLIDEFENFQDYQQQILNTLVKHNNSFYTFKIGVRELGFRQKATLNQNEQLTSPADYVRIDLTEKFQNASGKDANKFKEFAEAVIDSRLNDPSFLGNEQELRITDLLPALTQLEEANLLLRDSHLEWLKELENKLDKDSFKKAKEIEPGYLYFIKYWSEKEKDKSFPELVVDWISNGRDIWNTRLNNHFYASLFAIRSGKVGIRKYYTGWDTYLNLANGNIRYLLELVHAALLEHLTALEGKEINSFIPISFELQTNAAIQIGKKNLSELEGLSVEGAKLTKLLLSLGRVFGVLAASPLGHTPEANQFQLIPDSDVATEDKVKMILDQAVMHLAITRTPGNKLTDRADTKAYEYMIHPIFAPFFEFSHRKKRKIALSSSSLLKLIHQPKAGIKEVLDNSNRSESLGLQLPDQLQLFGSYYE
ncbi:TPA: hypothetical protein PVK60_000940 [Acinetobacter baumannii]|jgi:hypothetical protein|uniref:ATP-binding protein n=3 Tax=Acinetobacter baumannii TaxID=470 RepID=A0AAV3K5Q2_ACIBA|nr:MULTISPECIES: hypothetical protein [Acinetobacter]ERH73143.1 hypothetical protein N173_01905 [Acinetobacter baumannii EGD-HP18]MBJ9386898.1 hypothetical protein [Acinetobacter baumannii]MBJ9430952.1 hypothetical protein [Acinetobacter baumannii]MCE6409321.1 hypothetical protein [Acinetobacter baumannii]MCT9372999.1 hypothetical protein [Acinetobacter baumannii]